VGVEPTEVTTILGTQNMALARIEAIRRLHTIVTVTAIAVGATCFAVVISAVIIAVLLFLFLYAFSSFV
jgi:hypothetical protein